MNISISQWSGRFGNNILQLANVIWLTKYENCKICYIPPHNLIDTNTLVTIKNSNNNSIIIQKRFFDTNDMNIITSRRPTYPEYYQIFQNDIYPLLRCTSPNNNNNTANNNDTLVIHLRSGDCFKENTNNPHPLYVPLPLAYFQKVISDSYTDHFWKTILIVTEPDRVNPVIKSLQEWLSIKYPMIQLQIQSSHNVIDDINCILSAKHLVLSIGFFSKTLAMLSKQLNTLYYSDYIFQDILIPDKNYYFYSIKNYTKAGEWKDTRQQRKLITQLSTNDVCLLSFKRNSVPFVFDIRDLN